MTLLSTIYAFGQDINPFDDFALLHISMTQPKLSSKTYFHSAIHFPGTSVFLVSNNLGTKLTFLAFQCWFRIENRTNIKETMVILVISGTVVFLQT